MKTDRKLRQLALLCSIACVSMLPSSGQFAAYPDENPVPIKSSENDNRFRVAIRHGIDAINRRRGYEIKGYVVSGSVEKHRSLEVFYVMFFLVRKDSDLMEIGCYGFSPDTPKDNEHLIVRSGIDRRALFEVLLERLQTLKFADRSEARLMGEIAKIYLIYSSGPIHGVLHNPGVTSDRPLLTDLAGIFLDKSSNTGKPIDDLDGAMKKVVSSLKEDGLHALVTDDFFDGF